MPTRPNPLVALTLALALPCLAAAPPALTGKLSPGVDLFARSNLTAWCIVPFDNPERTPVARAEMLNRLGIQRLAYDWRQKHIPTFDAELDALHSHHIQLAAFWMTAGEHPETDPSVKAVLDLLRRRHVHTQIWLMYIPPAHFDTLSQEQKIAAASATVNFVAAEAARLGCTVGLYNHEGWYGEPENELAILKRVARGNVGLVYNFNHAQRQTARFPAFFPQILPHLMAVNLAGVERSGGRIVPVGEGDSEEQMIRIVWKSGYRGPIGIINENTDPDAERGLSKNIDGLQRILRDIGDSAALRTYLTRDQ